LWYHLCRPATEENGAMGREIESRQGSNRVTRWCLFKYIFTVEQMYFTRCVNCLPGGWWKGLVKGTKLGLQQNDVLNFDLGPAIKIRVLLNCKKAGRTPKSVIFQTLNVLKCFSRSNIYNIIVYFDTFLNFMSLCFKHVNWKFLFLAKRKP
jgi:hypothetical protein